MSDKLFILLADNAALEDIKIITDEDKAMEMSIKYPKMRVEIFEKGDDGLFSPIYDFYEKGKLVIYID